MMPTPSPIAVCTYQPGRVAEVLEFLKQLRWRLRSLHQVRVWTDRLCIYDVNGDFVEVTGLGYTEPDVIPVLESIGTAFKPDAIHIPIAAQYKEFRTSRRHPWAHDRVM